MQGLRRAACDRLADEAYASAHRMQSGAHLARPPRNNTLDPVAFLPLWPHVPLPDSCPLYARKFAPNVTHAREGFFEACDMLGMAARCVAHAALKAAG
jgi:hypothetical protein